MIKRSEVRAKEGLVVCEVCGTFASWELSCDVGWVGCAPCITGEADSFDPADLIASEYINDFVKEMNDRPCFFCEKQTNDNGCFDKAGHDLCRDCGLEKGLLKNV